MFQYLYLFRKGTESGETWQVPTLWSLFRIGCRQFVQRWAVFATPIISE
jgi:hypothetical protein